MSYILKVMLVRCCIPSFSCLESNARLCQMLFSQMRFSLDAILSDSVFSFPVFSDAAFTCKCLFSHVPFFSRVSAVEHCFGGLRSMRKQAVDGCQILRFLHFRVSALCISFSQIGSSDSNAHVLARQVRRF